MHLPETDYQILKLTDQFYQAYLFKGTSRSSTLPYFHTDFWLDSVLMEPFI